MKTQHPTYNRGYVLFIALIAAMGGLMFGYDLGVITGVVPFISEQFSLTGLYKGFVVAVFELGCMAGALGSSKYADQLGRKKTLIITAFFLIITALGVAFAPTAEWLAFWRFLQGVCVGAASVLSPMYIAEVSPSAERGKYVSMNQLTIIVGVLSSTIVCWYYGEVLDMDETIAWRWMLGSALLPAVLFFFALFFIPETPRWLVGASRPEEAERVIARIGGSRESQKAELREIEESLTETKTEQGTYRNLFSPAVLPALLVGMGLAFFQQFCGVNNVTPYMQDIFMSANMELGEGLLNAVFVNIVFFFTTVLSLFLVDRVGRKRLMLIGLGVMTLLLLALVWAFSAEQVNGMVVLVLITAYIGTFGFTLGPVVWVLLSEIFPNYIRAKALSVSSFVLWLSCFIVVLISPLLLEASSAVNFIFFAFFTLLGFCFCFFFLPETKGKSLEEIESLWVKNTSKRNKNN
ncbi:MAG: sugar porter family MFS transporter [Bacteroidales bacterium]|nr:sugar porter family MFS transporter [Bacteroidales bacterium]